MTDSQQDERVERLLDYVDVLEDCFGAALALLEGISQNNEAMAAAARDAMTASMARGPGTQIAAAQAGIKFRTPSLRDATPVVTPASPTQH
jgi:argininosuccinate lyase